MITPELIYSQPSNGWTCFHCGETFTTPGSARDHFGADPLAEPACRIKAGAERGILMALRKAEDELARYRNDDQVLARELYRLQSEVSSKLCDAEQLGYDRGLYDGLHREARSPKEIVEAANELAREFYEGMGYAVPEGYRFDKARHPQEKLCWYLASRAYEALAGTDLDEVLEDLENAE